MRKKSYEYGIEMYVSPFLKKKLKLHLLVVIALFVPAVLVIEPRYDPDVGTLRILYSSLFQGFAALAGLLVAILGLNYGRLKDAQDRFMDDARAAEKSLLKNVDSDRDRAKENILKWFHGIFRKRTQQLAYLTKTVENKYPFKALVDVKDPDVVAMKSAFKQLESQTRQYESMVCNYGGYLNSSAPFNDTLSAASILAIIPAFIVMLLSLCALSNVDHWSMYQSFITITVVFLSVVVIFYAVSFFRTMLRTFFGGLPSPTRGYKETKLPKPDDANTALEKVRKITGW